MPNTDTLHALIREFRDTRKIPLNVEHRLMLGMAPDYDHLTVIQKVEVFQHALESTSGAARTPSPLSGPEPLSIQTSCADPTILDCCCICPPQDEPHWPTATCILR